MYVLQVPFMARSAAELYDVIQTQPVEYPSDVALSPEGSDKI